MNDLVCHRLFQAFIDSQSEYGIEAVNVSAVREHQRGARVALNGDPIVFDDSGWCSELMTRPSVGVGMFKDAYQTPVQLRDVLQRFARCWHDGWDVNLK